MFSGVLLVGYVGILARCVEPLVFGVEFTGLFEDPTISVGMVCRSPGGNVDLTYFVQDFVEVRQLVPIIFGRRLFLILLRAFESGIDCLARWAVVFDSALFFVTTRFPLSISEFGCTRVAGAPSCQLAVLSCAKAGHEAC